MGNSMFDQLKKSGLVDENKAKQARQDKREQVRRQKGKRHGSLDESRLRAQQAQAGKAEQDRELNRQRRQAVEQKAVTAQVKQLIEMNRVEDGDSDVAFNFTDGNNVQRLYVSERSRGQLAQGRLAIVKLEGRYDLVPATVAEKIRQRNHACIVLFNVDRPDAGDADDPYADYQVPDDLMW